MANMYRQSLNLPQDVYSSLCDNSEGVMAETLRKLVSEYAEGRTQVKGKQGVYKSFGFYADLETLEKAKRRAKAEGTNLTKVLVELLRELGQHNTNEHGPRPHPPRSPANPSRQARPDDQ